MKNRGFTLVELLVAITLMVILTGSIVYIFTSGQRIFRDSDRQVQIFQTIRMLVDSIEREFPIAVNTHNMEFFTDNTDNARPRNGQYEPASDKIMPGQVVFSDLQSELGSGPGASYIASMAIHGEDYEDPKSKELFRCDAIYYRAVTNVKGARRNALICYCIETDVRDDEPPIQGSYSNELKCLKDKRYLPVLKRYVIYKDPKEPTVLKYLNSDLCSYVLDFKVSYFFHNPHDSTDEAKFIELPAGTTKEFCYRGEGQIREVDGQIRMEYPNFTPAPENAADKFSQIAPGDKIFLYVDEKTDEWTWEDNREYIIDAIDRSTGTIYFRPGSSPPISPDPAMPLDVKFRAGYLPSCVIMSFKICDESRSIIRHVTRYFKIKAM
ncbi:MAG: type II secretion system protein [Planctomycetota bacterium]|nr:MAG: type II secretion system protein [Planctomycetota bacterium]